MKTAKQLEMRVKDQLKAQSKANGIDFNILKKKYFLDSFLRVFSSTTYRQQFIWKGGFVLTAMSSRKY